MLVFRLFALADLRPSKRELIAPARSHLLSNETRMHHGSRLHRRLSVSHDSERTGTVPIWRPRAGPGRHAGKCCQNLAFHAACLSLTFTATHVPRTFGLASGVARKRRFGRGVCDDLRSLAPVADREAHAFGLRRIGGDRQSQRAGLGMPCTLNTCQPPIALSRPFASRRHPAGLTGWRGTRTVGQHS